MKDNVIRLEIYVLNISVVACGLCISLRIKEAGTELREIKEILKQQSIIPIEKETK